LNACLTPRSVTRPNHHADYQITLPNEQTSKSLQSRGLCEFNDGMKVKILIGAVFAGCILGSLAFAQSLQIKGNVSSVNDTQVEVQCDGATWVIKLTPSTTVTPAPTLGTTVTVQAKCPDAQRKENPIGTPTPTPSGTQSLQIKGKVADLKPNMITLTSDTETWCVRQGPGTNTAVVSGDLIVGKPVTLKCNCPDAQRKEGPVCFPTPSPMATPKPTPTATAANG